MTVKDLIMWLSDLPQDAYVKIYDEHDDKRYDVEVITADSEIVTLIGG